VAVQRDGRLTQFKQPRQAVPSALRDVAYRAGSGGNVAAPGRRPALGFKTSACCAKVRIDPGQQHDLAQALVSELDITVGDD